MRKVLAAVVALAFVTLSDSTAVCAQVVEQPKAYDVGDKATYRWVLNTILFT
jgi:hypothetical protein